MRTSSLYVFILSGTLAMAQGPSFTNLQRTTGTMGITPGQTARLTAVYPAAPAPIDQIVCAATLSIADDQGNILASKSVTGLIAGKSASVDLDADTTTLSAPRTQIHGFSIAPAGCNVVTSLELIDNITQKTVIVVGSQRTYPQPAVRAVLSFAARP